MTQKSAQLDRLTEALRLHGNALHIILKAPSTGAESKIFMEVIEYMKERGERLRQKIQELDPASAAPPAPAVSPAGAVAIAEALAIPGKTG